MQGLSYAQALSNVNDIIDTIQAANPNVTIIIEQMAPAHSDFMIGELATFFMQMQEDVISLAVEQSTEESSVIPVDMASGFSNSLLADAVHYNQEGAEFVADKYYEVLSALLQE